MKILFVALPEKGHLHPLIAPAQELQRRGHEVAFYASRDLSAPLARAGLTRVFAGNVFGGNVFGDRAPPDDGNRGAALAELLGDRDRLRRWIRALLLDDVAAEVERLRAVLREFAPRVVAADPMAYQAPIAAMQAQLPWVGLSTSLNPVAPAELRSELIATVEELAPARDALFARHGCKAQFRVCDCLSPAGTIAFTTEALVGAPPPGVILAGPSLPRDARGDEPPFAWERLDARPLVYLSFGSQNWHQPRALATVIEAARGQPWQLVAAVGELAPPPLPDNVLVVNYAPQLALYRRAQAAITHGGANSIMEALASSLPLLVSPFCNDQPHNTRFVVAAGAGLELDLDRASAAECRAAVAALLAPGPLRDGAARIGADYAARDGAAIAADHLLAVA